MIELKKYVRSYVPGRLRLRHPELKRIDKETQELIIETVKSAAGMIDCVINPKVGSLLLTWDPKALTEKDFLQYLSFWSAFIPSFEEETKSDSFVGKTALKSKAIQVAKDATHAGLDFLVPFLAPDQKKSARSRRVTQNRLMLAAGTASVVMLALGRSKHAFFGWTFAALALVHLYQHRTVI